MSHTWSARGLARSLALASLLASCTDQNGAGTGGTGGEQNSAAGAAGSDDTAVAMAGSAAGRAGATTTDGTGSSDAGPDSGGGSAKGGAALECTATELERLAPTLVVLLDQSGSMDQQFDGANRSTRVAEALTAADSPLRRLQNELRIGLTLFTSNGGFGANPGSPRICPMLQSVGASLLSFTAIETLLAASPPQGDSPGAESVSAVAQQLVSMPSAAPASILWIVDGNTDTCADPSLFDEVVTSALAVQALTTAYGLGISTQLLTMGPEPTDGPLQEQANAGAGGDPSAHGFRVTTAAELASALTVAVDKVRTCEFQLELPLSAGRAAQAQLLLGESELAFGASDGWALPTDTTVRLLGSACNTLKANAAPVTLKRCP
jgi:hypothetical protein